MSGLAVLITKTLIVHASHPELEIIAEARATLLNGGLVAFPTETVYGLGANVYDPAAVARIFEAKGRPPEDPLIVHLTSTVDLPHVAINLPDIVQELADRFWPGPLTLVLHRHPHINPAVSAGLDTVAVRVPAHPVAQALLKASGVPIVAPSANLFGHPSPTTAKHVYNDLAGRIDLILDGGPTNVGVESTVLDVTGEHPVILRPGGVTLEALRDLLGDVRLLHNQKTARIGAQISPGLLDKHYAPNARLIYVRIPNDERMIQAMWHSAHSEAARGHRIGLLLADEDQAYFTGIPAHVALAGSAADLTEIARNLYRCIRQLDETPVDVIIARDFGEQGIGLAIRDRLTRAASQVITSETFSE